jgi:hypothetical protein
VHFTFEDTKPAVSDADILSDIRRVANDLGVATVRARAYRHHGRFSATVAKTRFGSWNNALRAAGLSITSEHELTDEQLFDNLREVWMLLGRQPRTAEMCPPHSRYSRHPYKRRFGSWLTAMKAFVAAIDQPASNGADVQALATISRGPRDPSLRLRFLVMRRDSFKCRHCGRSPANDSTIELHVDHIVPWANGGQTYLDNLQTLCSKCNFGKGDLPEYHDG